MKYHFLETIRTRQLRFIIRILPICALMPWKASAAHAHATDQAFVLLLPTDIYITAGVAAVALTVAALFLVPQSLAGRLFASRQIATAFTSPFQTFTSLLSTLILTGLLYVGYTGTSDPLMNPLPLAIWTLWWIAMPLVQAVFGNVWLWINPWTGLCRISGAGRTAIVPLPRWIRCWPAVGLFLLYAVFALADPAPDNPRRLATVAGAYWMLTFLAIILFGQKEWLNRGECFTVALRFFALLAPVARAGGKALRIGVPGWKLQETNVGASGAVFAIVLLGTGSFDGLNETFWWLWFIGINPLEFPGRTAIITDTIAGLLAANLLLVAIFTSTVLGGFRLIARPDIFRAAFCRLALALLPIALSYHVAHFLTSFLVNGQYALAAFSDPLGAGWDLLGLGTYYVTTGFFNSRDSVELIWLTQAGVIVVGHIWAILLGHAIALRLTDDARKASISQVPVALFMIAYTLFGLWLLASPRGA